MPDVVLKGWTATTLGQVVHLQRGHDLPLSARIPGAVPVIGSGDADGWHDQAMARGPGVVIGRATNLGRPKFVRDDYWPLNTTLYVKDFKGNDPRWVYYLFQTLDLTGYNSGSVQPMLNRNYIQGVPILFPPLLEQQAIAEVLGALDDKIEANRRAGVLAGQLVTAYFMSLTSLQNPTRSWPSVPLSQLCAKIDNGGTPSRAEPSYWDGAVRWFKTGELNDGPLTDSNEHISERGLERSSCKIWPAGTVLIALYASPTVGRLGILTSPASANQACSALIPRSEIGTPFLYESLLATRGRLQDIAVGSAQQNISQSVVKNHLIPKPVLDVITQFNRVAEPVLALRTSYLRQSFALCTLRDALLPKLLSGELRVRAVESLVEEVV